MIINLDDEKYVVRKDAEEYLETDYPCLLEPGNASDLVTQMRLDPNFRIKAEQEVGREVFYVSMNQQEREFGIPRAHLSNEDLSNLACAGINSGDLEIYNGVRELQRD